MDLAKLTYSELKSLLYKHDWKIVSDADWETHNRVMIGKEGHAFPLQIKDVYYYPFVFRLCTSLGIPVPEHCLKSYQQEQEYKRQRESEKKEKGEK